MSNDLLTISLNQGKNFNTYQTKIKHHVSNNKSKRVTIKEGFVTLDQEKLVRPKGEGYVTVLENQERVTKQINSINQRDLDEFQQLNTQFNDLFQQYTDIKQSIENSSTSTMNRLSSNNPYLNKTIRFSSGDICYVTAQGVVKYIPSIDILNSTNAPKTYIDINLPWLDSYNTPGTMIPTNPPLISGTAVKINESLGNEGLNVYASKLINNPTSDYIGCYNDTPLSVNINIIPIMNSSNNINGFISSASSVYMDNNDTLGPWAAFDQNPGTMWHSDDSLYNTETGVYEGSNSVGVANTGTITGEFLQINMPGFNTSSAQKIKANQYSLAPRLDLITTRSPNSWFILGYDGNQWNQIDRQMNQRFTSGNPKFYNIANPGDYSGYILLVDKVGNDDQTSNRNSVQVAEWNLFMNTDNTITDDKRAMVWNQSIIGYTTLDKCQGYAIDNGYQYFGMQDYQTDGTAACLISNDLLRTQMYGDASNKRTIIPIWETNTANTGGSYAILGGRGRFFIKDIADTVLWQSSDKDPINCAVSYSFSESTNAPGNDLEYYNNVTLDFCQSKCTNNEQCYGIVLNNNNNDCWTKSQFNNIKPEENISLYQKVKSKENCKFIMILQDDGNLCIYQGSPDNIKQPAVWTTKTTGKQLQPNSEWEASKSSFGRNYIIGGESLAIDQWIGSNNGSLKLQMMSNGNLVLYTSDIKAGCIKGQNDKIYGGKSVNAVYKINSVGNINALGKVGYIDSDSILKEYPNSMLEYSNDYEIYQNTNFDGNDITSMIVTDETQCQSNCNNNINCAAYSFMPSTNTCWLKDSSNKKYPMSDRNIGIRKPKLKATGSTNCSNQIVDIDTIQYDKYIKGDTMTTDTQCNKPFVSQEDRTKLDNITNQLIILGQDIASKMENLYNQDNKVYEKLNMNAQQFKKDLQKYKNINIKISQELNLQSNNNIEGMQNLNLNMNDINGMLSDTDLRVLQGNYSYIMWSILAVGILTITINTMRK